MTQKKAAPLRLQYDVSIFVSNRSGGSFRKPEDLAKEAKFRTELEKQGQVVAHFSPPNYGLVENDLFPQLPPEITIFKIQ